MSETVRSSTSDPDSWSASNGYKGTTADNASTSYENTEGSGEAGKTLVVGLLGGLLSAAGYLIYQRLPEEQKDRLHGQVKGMLAQRINEIRQNFNI